MMEQKGTAPLAPTILSGVSDLKGIFSFMKIEIIEYYAIEINKSLILIVLNFFLQFLNKFLKIQLLTFRTKMKTAFELL